MVNAIYFDIIYSTDGVLSISVNDRDGVEILRGKYTFNYDQIHMLAPSNESYDTDSRQQSQLLSTIFNITHEQCEKLDGFGTTDSFIVRTSFWSDEHILGYI